MNIKIGDTDSFTKTMSEVDVYNFAGICGDFNSVHINKVKAEKSRFKGQICQGMLVASFISNVLGMKLPGQGTVYLEQNLKFVAPVYIGDTITAIVEVIDIYKERIVTLKTTVVNQDEIEVVTGTAKVMIE